MPLGTKRASDNVIISRMPKYELARPIDIFRYRNRARLVRRRLKFTEDIKLQTTLRANDKPHIHVEVRWPNGVISAFAAEANIDQFEQHLIKIIKRIKEST